MVRCPECGSQYFHELHRVDEQGQHVKMSEKELPVQKCASCGHMLTVQEGQPKTFSEARAKPKAMLDDSVENPVQRG